MTPDVFEKFKKLLPPDYSIDVNPELVGVSQKHRFDFVIRPKNSWEELSLVMFPEDGLDAAGSDVTKLWNMRRDLGYGNPFIIAPGHIDPNIVNTANARGIKLMDENCINRMIDLSAPYGLHRYLSPIIFQDEAERMGEMKAKKESGYSCIRVGKLQMCLPTNKWSRFLRLPFAQDKPGWRFVGATAVWYPYYEIIRESMTRNEPNAGISKMTVKKSKTLMDARLGWLVVCYKDGISYKCGWDWKEAKLLDGAGKKITDEVRHASGIGWLDISRAQDNMVHRGLIESDGNSRDYKVNNPVFEDRQPITEHYNGYFTYPPTLTMDATVSAKDAAYMVRLLGGHVTQIDTVFVPYYVFRFVVYGEEKTFVVSAMSEKFQPVPEIHYEVSSWLQRKDNSGEKQA